MSVLKWILTVVYLETQVSLFLGDVEKYIRETARVLRPGGRLYATYKFLNNRSRAGIVQRFAGIDLAAKLQDAKAISFNSKTVEKDIAHAEDEIVRLHHQVGLRIIGTEYGNWPTGLPSFPKPYQDTLVAKKNEAEIC